MSNDDFEKGLDLLLNNAYNVPSPSENFRNNLLANLKQRQRTNTNIRRARVITLYSSFSAVAAVILFAFIPNIDIFSNTDAEISISPKAELAAATKTLSKNVVTDKINYISSNTETSATTKLASYSSPFHPTTAYAINSVDVYNPVTNKWATIEDGKSFALTNGTQIRTPLGATESVNISLKNGPSVMLDGMSQIAINDNLLTLEDGRAVISVSKDSSPVTIQLDNQDINLDSGSMVFATLDNDNSYAKDGLPAPILVLLKGTATTANSNDSQLAQGRVYELFDTGTGHYPSRKVGSYENKRQFMPMIDAVQAAYKSK